MKQFNREIPGLTVGLDLSDRDSHYAVVDRSGELVEEQRVRTTSSALQRAFSKQDRMRIVLEVGTHSPWVSRLLMEEPHRFARSRSVGPYLGLCPRQWQSGMQQSQLRITKAGDAMLRCLLVSAANYILGPFGPDTSLRRWGEQLVARGGRHAKQRAVVAVARKLACLLHSMWVHERAYDSENVSVAA